MLSGQESQSSCDRRIVRRNRAATPELKADRNRRRYTVSCRGRGTASSIRRTQRVPYCHIGSHLPAAIRIIHNEPSSPGQMLLCSKTITSQISKSTGQYFRLVDIRSSNRVLLNKTTDSSELTNLYYTWTRQQPSQTRYQVRVT